MASSIMMQNMCNNQINDLGMYGSQFNQVNYGSPDASYPAGSEFASPMFVTTPQTLGMPAANYSGGVSPQMVPMGYPAMTPPLSLPAMTPPLVDMSLTSVSPPPTMATVGSLLPPVPMMGYSMLPMANGMTYLVPTASASPENQFFLVPDTPQVSISRSVTPVRDEIASEKMLIKEISRERLPSSASSNGSLDSSASGIISKKELVEDCLRHIGNIFGSRVQTNGMRGPTVMRIKVKTRPALELIVDLLRTLEAQCNIIAISCPKSTKKGKQHIRGFLAYIQTATVAEIDQVQWVFDEFNRTHTSGEDAPFKSLEVNPQKKQN